VLVRAQVDGQITEVAFKEGQQLKLATFSSRLIRASIRQSRSSGSQRAQDQAQLENARLDLKRYTSLIEKNSVARQQFDTTQAQVAQLEATVKGDEALIEYAR